jgi:cytoskeletal protein RodZ
MSVIFKSLKKIKNREAERSGAGSRRTRTSGSVYSYRRILLSPLVLLLAVGVLAAAGFLVYYAYQLWQDSAPAPRRTARVPAEVAESHAVPEERESASGSVSRNEEAAFDAPQPPGEVPVEETEPESLNLSEYSSPSTPGESGGPQRVTVVESGAGSGPETPRAAERAEGPEGRESAEARSPKNTRPSTAAASTGSRAGSEKAGGTTKRVHGSRRPETRETDRPDPAKAARLASRIRTAVSRGDDAAADQLLADLVSMLGPDHKYILNLKAFRAMRRGDDERAAVLLSRVLNRNRQDLDAGLNMAVLEMRTGRTAEAEQRLLLLEEKYPDNRHVRALLSKLGR